MTIPNWARSLPKGVRMYVVIAIAVTVYCVPKVVNHVVNVQVLCTWRSIPSEGTQPNGRKEDR